MKKLTITVKGRQNRKSSIHFNKGLVNRLIVKNGSRVIIDKEYQYNPELEIVSWGRGGVNIKDTKELRRLSIFLSSTTSIHQLNFNDLKEMVERILQFKTRNSLGEISNLPKRRYFSTERYLAYKRTKRGAVKRKRDSAFSRRLRSSTVMLAD